MKKLHEKSMLITSVIGSTSNFTYKGVSKLDTLNCNHGLTDLCHVVYSIWKIPGLAADDKIVAAAEDVDSLNSIVCFGKRRFGGL
jgi:hypothetical protein